VEAELHVVVAVDLGGCGGDGKGVPLKERWDLND
jgi:hypothetical protein